eukprot:gb/GECG01002309.1/.p1 GENE.gb/GECG01002309.1/~~gb/GECG01002309.1/.p1  ORF type:complete len:174 (+),score=24.09 gb/GECG01002309.1/:1-522(+)
MAAAPQWPPQGPSEQQPTFNDATNDTDNSSFDAETQVNGSNQDTGRDGQSQYTSDQAKAGGLEEEDDRYYWEREPEENMSVTTQTQLWHQAHWMGAKAVEGMEVVGEVCANIFGFNNSEFQDIYNSYKRQQVCSLIFWRDVRKLFECTVQRKSRRTGVGGAAKASRARTAENA